MAAEEPTTKRCTKCGETKPVSEFGKQASRKDGLNPWCKACKKAAGADYYSRNKAAILERNRRWEQENPERRRAQIDAWNKANPERVKKYNRDYHTRNPGLRSKWQKAHYARHRDKITAENRARWRANADRYRPAAARWSERNKDLKRQYSRNYKARQRNAIGTHTAADIQRIFGDQRGRCAYCGRPLRNGFHVDHITPLSKGGTNEPKNLQLTCAFCNISKKDKDPILYARRLGRLL